MSESESIQLIFHGNLASLLPKGKRSEELRYPLRRRASIKDIIQSLAVPHTEVGRIELARNLLAFHHIAGNGEVFHIYPFTNENSVLRPTILRPRPLSTHSFMADNTVAKLSRNMRMAGLDTATAPEGHLVETAGYAHESRRILISRNRDLLKCTKVTFGQLIRSLDHTEQLAEVLSRFSLADQLQPFSRCLVCNTLLEKTEKDTIIDRLQPLTRKYYFSFKKCPGCGKIYWHGSHLAKMQKILDNALAVVPLES